MGSHCFQRATPNLQAPNPAPIQAGGVLQSGGGITLQGDKDRGTAPGPCSVPTAPLREFRSKHSKTSPPNGTEPTAGVPHGCHHPPWALSPCPAVTWLGGTWFCHWGTSTGQRSRPAPRLSSPATPGQSGDTRAPLAVTNPAQQGLQSLCCQVPMGKGSFQPGCREKKKNQTTKKSLKITPGKALFMGLRGFGAGMSL